MGISDQLKRLFNNGRELVRSRTDLRVNNNLGVIKVDINQSSGKFRDPKLELFDAYYENRQYDNLPCWDQQISKNGGYLPIRHRQPRLKLNYAKTLTQRITAKLVGDSVFPDFKIEESPIDQEFFEAVIRESKLKAKIIEPTRRMLNTGSIFVRFLITGGTFKIDWHESKYCYPVFQDNGELESVKIQYVYDDKKDLDENKNPRKKWFRLDLGMFEEILYDNPIYEPNVEPIFTEADRVTHGLGFVQGEWFRTVEHKDSPDGFAVVEDIMDFIDEVNYSLSQSSQAVSYNQDPQLTINGMDDDDLNSLIKSSTKSWNLGREGKANFLESNLGGVERAIELRDKVRLNIQDISRIVLLDPDKVLGAAQSGKAMEVLHGPLKDFVDELRLPVGNCLKNLILKMGLACLMADRQGIEVPIMIPPGYQPQSLNLELDWPPIFQQTIEDLQKKVQVASSAASGNLISRETCTKYLAKDFGVTNVEEEIAKIAAQPVINPFGGF